MGRRCVASINALLPICSAIPAILVAHLPSTTPHRPQQPLPTYKNNRSFCCAVVHAVVGRAHCSGYEGPMFLCGSDNDTVELRQCRQADFSDWNLWFFLKIENVLAS
ncbi:uncharacterized protein [Zea mays]|uniref:uncharacterized protein n=1 Tax=Zea mays TaxID=4577 RepID=UPI0004DE93D3|nr:uncharacterized protein LOC103629900 [Zea mays]|eukprot:XP_008649218.1 uncharacterized protein LOC103629900 [Zea mays]